MEHFALPATGLLALFILLAFGFGFGTGLTDAPQRRHSTVDAGTDAGADGGS